MVCFSNVKTLFILKVQSFNREIFSLVISVLRLKLRVGMVSVLEINLDVNWVLKWGNILLIVVFYFISTKEKCRLCMRIILKYSGLFL